MSLTVKLYKQHPNKYYLCHLQSNDTNSTLTNSIYFTCSKIPTRASHGHSTSIRLFGTRHEPLILQANTASERNTYLTPLVTFLASCKKHLSPWRCSRAVPSVGATCETNIVLSSINTQSIYSKICIERKFTLNWSVKEIYPTHISQEEDK